MVERIRSAFREELTEITWMDYHTKRLALEKADAMNHFIGYPDWYSQDSAVDDYYRGVSKVSA